MATLKRNNEPIADVIKITSFEKKKHVVQFGSSVPLENLPAIEFTTDTEVDFTEEMGVSYVIDDITERYRIEETELAMITADRKHFVYHAYKGHTEKKT